MAAPARTASGRLHDDYRLWGWLVVVVAFIGVLAGSYWPRPGHPGNWWAVAHILAVGLFATGFLGVALHRRYRRGGPHWSDRWQAEQGRVADLAISGAVFNAESLSQKKIAGSAANGGAKALFSGVGAAGTPLVGGALATGMLTFGASLLAAGAVIGIGAAVEQNRRDRAMTRTIRGEVHYVLQAQHQARAAELAALAVAPRHRARGGLRLRVKWRQARLARECGYLDEAITRLENLGYTPLGG